MNLVDLAGAEKIEKTGAKGQQLKEGIAINQSLTALAKVMIHALTDALTDAAPRPWKDNDAAPRPWKGNRPCMAGDQCAD